MGSSSGSLFMKNNNVALPLNSSDFNPIEKLFAKLKALLRKAAERTVEGLWPELNTRFLQTIDYVGNSGEIQVGVALRLGRPRRFLADLDGSGGGGRAWRARDGRAAWARLKRLVPSGAASVRTAFASMKSFRPKDGSGEPLSPGRNGEADFRKTKRSNETHVSTTDKDARLFRKGDGQESRLSYLGHALMENRNGLVVAAEATLATGTA